MALRPVTLITGASAGIGSALAHVFAANGHEVVLVARREQLLTSLADAIAATGAIRPIVLRADVARIDAARRIGEALAAAGVEPTSWSMRASRLLGLRQLDRGQQLAMIDLNVRALTDLPRLRRYARAPPGSILNVASVAAFLPGPDMAVYYATKAYVLYVLGGAASRVRPQGVQVTALCPGPVPTGFRLAGVKAACAAHPHPLRRAGRRGRLSRAAGRHARAWCRDWPTS
jgi:short-subunit dehydrogenase